MDFSGQSKQVTYERIEAQRSPHTDSEMSSYDIAVIRGDGIGKEVVEEGLKVLDAVGSSEDISWNFTEFPWGSDYYLEHGMMLPERRG